MNTRFAINVDCGKHVAFNLTEDQTEKLLGWQNVIEYLVHIGLKNVLQDSHASVVRSDFETEDEWIAAKRDRAALKFGALMSGDVRSTTKPRAPKVDDFTNVARKLVLALLPKETKKALAELEDKGASKLDAIFEKNEAKLRPQVERKLEEMRKAAEAAKGLELDLDEDLI